MIARLSELLRRSLDSSSAAEVSLQEELGFLNLYLDIEKTRFYGRLSVTLRIGQDTESALVPSLILRVWNNGRGLKSPFQEGDGLKPVRGRLEKLYSERQTFELKSVEGGVAARILIPYRAEEPLRPLAAYGAN
jgi:LytS/YehU family sensor histidine kinase